MSEYRLIPGDDWTDILVTVNDNTDNPIPLTGLTLTGYIRCAGTNAKIPLTISTTGLLVNQFQFGAAADQTFKLPIDELSKFKIKATTSGNKTYTLFCMPVKGVNCL